MSESIWLEEPRGGYPDPALMGLSGLERMRAGRRAQMPAAPLVYLTGMRFLGALSAGHSAFAIPASPWFANATGLIPGGVLAMLSDAPLGGALFTDLEPGRGFTTAELSLSFLRPVRPRPEGVIGAYGQLIHHGGSVGLTEAFLLDEESEELVAFGSSRLSIFPPLDPVPEPPAEMPELEGPWPGELGDDPIQRPVRGEPLAAELFAERSGLQILRGLASGELPAPPLSELTGMRPIEAEQGRVTLALPCSPWLSTSARTVQGGFTAMLAEAALAAAALSIAEAGTAVAPLDLKVNFLRPVFPDGRDLRAVAEVVNSGRTLTVTGARVLNADDKPVALATGSAMNLPGRPADLAGVELG